MSILDTHQLLGVADAARRLELHPFEVVRILVADGSLPSALRLDAATLARVRSAGGLETWWEAPATPEANEKDEIGRAHV
jgi:CO/xanthine dehydrogenase Mo-binding subunit